MLCSKLRRSAHLIFSIILAFCRIENDICKRQFFWEKSPEKVVSLLVKYCILIAPFFLLSVSVQDSYAGKFDVYPPEHFLEIKSTLPENAGNGLSLTLTVTNVTCFGGNNGSISSNLSGGSGGTVNYTLTPGSVTNTTGVFPNLIAAAYTVLADDGGTTISASVNVTEPPVTSLPSITLGAFPVYCPGVPNFLLNYISTSGTPISYSLSAGVPAMPGFVSLVNAALGASPLTISLPAGVNKGSYQFILTVKNATGCTSTVQTFSMNFDDTTKPVFTAPSDITIFNDPTGNINVLPAVTGNVVILSDNCTAVSNLITTYSDGAPVPIGGGCNLPYTITRTWKVTDAAGNFEVKTQLITVKDNIKPNLTTPPDLTLSCEQSILPASTGTATATDNSSPTTITFVDNVLSGTCSGNNTISRTWTATDCSGNTTSGIQTIIVSDNTKPVATVPNISVGCPADIPVPYATLAQFITAGGTATDNCGALSLILFSEIANGLAGKPGYCPTSVTRVYRISDPCGNYTDVVQTISVQGECGCSKCVTGTNFHLVDFLGQPTGSIEFDDQKRNGACCVDANCISFNVRLDPNAIGVEILVEGATPSPQDWRIDCVSVTITGNTICMPTGSFHLFTYCKPGANKNEFSFRSIPGVIVPGNITTRVDCNSQITATGIQSNPVWNSISPGSKGQYNSYLSSTTVANPFFVADVNSPPVIQYEVCGNIGTTVCNALGTDCAVATVYVKQKIGLVWNTDPSLVCLGNMPTLTANISPAGSYSYNWYNGHGATGAVIYSGSASYKPSAVGPYSLTVTDILSGGACNTAVFDFDVAVDNVGPSLLAPPSPLSIQCGDPAANQQITNWLASATTTYTKPDGTVVNVVPTNNYSGITMACNSSVDVTFSASDQCGNVSSITSKINVIDTQPPVFTSCPANLTINTDAGKCYATGVSFGVASVTDCSSVTVTNNAPAQLPTGVNLVTWTATDACGNKTTCTQTVTVKDNISPVISCPANVTQTALPGNCSLSNVTIPAPVSSDNCSVITQKWTMSGATVGSSPATGINDVSGQTFNVGITTVSYTVVDGAGNTTSCSFNVWIKDLNKPVVTSGCPADVTKMNDPGLCSAVVSIPKLVVSDPCNEGYTVKNSFNNTDDASGIYPVGVTTVNWTITDASGNSTFCIQKITINDKNPSLSCTANITVNADFEKTFASNVAIATPVYGDDCPGLSLIWNMTGASTGSSPATGVNIFPTPSLFNLGITTIQYTATDASGHTAICSFTVTVLTKPDINCQPNITKNNDPSLCSAAFDPGFPVKLSGADPITYSWSMTGATPASGTASGTGSIIPIPYTFNVGATIITWTATNVSGSDMCSQTVTVVDKDPPVFNAPSPFSFCVVNIITAAMVSSALKINPAPDYYLFKSGSTVLDVNPATFSDNCTPVNQLVLHWQIDFSATTPAPSISGTGQPSAYPSDIVFPGDGITFMDVTHTITYWVVDLNGNESVHKTVPITIHPRPAVSEIRCPSFLNYIDPKLRS
ncbi:MAG: HYR domain-containing protein [Bacteroidia bacterium]|nr:HYR domain-containing protein [Bacteroidia bacterium]